MKTIRLKKHPYFYVKPVNRHGSIVLEVSDEPFRIPDHLTMQQLAGIWQEKQLGIDYEFVTLHL